MPERKKNWAFIVYFNEMELIIFCPFLERWVLEYFLSNWGHMSKTAETKNVLQRKPHEPYFAK